MVQMKRSEKMCGLSKKQVRLRRILSTVVIAVYLTVTSVVDLCHTESWQWTTLNPNAVDSTRVLSPDEPCPACAFLAGSNSTEISFASPLVNIHIPIVYQALPYSSVIIVEKCIHSTILLRAPPVRPIV